MIHFTPFEVKYYEEEIYVLKGIEKKKIVSLREVQCAILKNLRQSKNFLSELFLPTGVLAKQHLNDCFALYKKLSEAGVIVLANGARQESAENKEPDLLQKKHPFDLSSYAALNDLADTILGVGSKLFSYFTSAQLLILLFIFSAAALLLFPFDLAVLMLKVTHEFSIWRAELMGYFCVTIAFWLRTVLQMGVLRAEKRSLSDFHFTFFGPFLGLNFNRDEIVMCGRATRIRVAMIGLFAPMILAFVFLLAQLLHLCSPVANLIANIACLFSVLVLLFPLFPLDGAELLHCVLYPKKTTEKVSRNFSGVLAGTEKVRDTFFFYSVQAIVCILVWSEGTRLYFELFLPELGAHPRQFAVANVFVYFCLFAPVFLIFYYLSDRFLGMFKKSKSGISREAALTFDEQMSALQKIPLFVSLAEPDRLSLFNNMSTQFFAHGEYLVKQGDVGDSFFVMVRGHAEAIFVDTKGREYHVGELQGGDAFGEVALIDDVPRTASIISKRGCHVLMLKKEIFQKFAENLGSTDKVKQFIRLTSFLRRNPLLARLPASDQAALIERMRFETITEGEKFVPAGEYADGFFIIYSGKIKVDSGDDRTDQYLIADDAFSLRAISVGVQVNYSAVESAALLKITNAEFDELIWKKLSAHPEIFLC